MSRARIADCRPWFPGRSADYTRAVECPDFDSPTLAISPDLARSEMDVSARHAVLTMKAVSGSIWMLDNVDR